MHHNPTDHSLSRKLNRYIVQDCLFRFSTFTALLRLLWIQSCLPLSAKALEASSQLFPLICGVPQSYALGGPFCSSSTLLHPCSLDIVGLVKATSPFATCLRSPKVFSSQLKMLLFANRIPIHRFTHIPHRLNSEYHYNRLKLTCT